MSGETLVLLTAAGTIVTILTSIVGQVRGWWESPSKREERAKAEADRQRSEAVAVAILGVSEVRDLAGGIITKGQPGLVARTGTLEEAVVNLVNQDARLGRVEARVEVVEGTVSGILAELLDRAADKNLEAVKRSATGQAEIIDAEETP